MTSNNIRQKFLDFFKRKGHTIVQSDLLVPKDDPTLLFTGAGMNQFKEQFMARNITFKRAASCQKCLRTADLDNVGRTPRHHTFFEMLGNFSFGDYFRREAIQWAWEFMTKEMAISPERLWISVYKDDDESYKIWLDEIKVPAKKIAKLGPSENFWPADAPTKGPNGPCGPCSEIFYDWGEDVGCRRPGCDPSCDCERFVEVWNLVFTEFERRNDGTLVPLPNKNIDTGMGLERMASVMQNVRTNFETDLFIPIIDQIKKNLAPSHIKVIKESLSLIADHIRAATFAICDGVSPSNEKRGYVVRKLIRRAYLKSGKDEPFLYNLVPKVAEVMGDVYPELEEKREHISAIIQEEERRFTDTLNAAMPILEELLARGVGVLSGDEIFKLVDTYGLPLEIIKEKAEKAKIKLDIDGFENLMDKRKDESRLGSDILCDFIFKPDLFFNAPKPPVSEKLPLEATLEFVLKDDKESNEILEKECAEIITSPQSSFFYAEAGGQIGDKGIILKSNASMDIVNTVETDGRKIFQVIVRKGSFKKGDKIKIDLDEARKLKTAKNHTATHLLQAALRSVLGDHVKQSGSYVDDKRLRFDFTHMKKLSSRELEKVERLVNEWVEEAISVGKEKKSLKEAKGEGALSFFGEKYGDIVRVVSIGSRSKELCGGTHVDNTSQIELVKITSESSVASGIRRIEALTSENARTWIKQSLKNLLEECSQVSSESIPALGKDIRSYVDDIINGKIKIDKNVIHDYEGKIKPVLVDLREKLEKAAKIKEKQKESDSFNKLKQTSQEILDTSPMLGKVRFVSSIFKEVDMPLLRKLVGYLEGKVTDAVILLGSSVKEDKAYLICAVTKGALEKGIDACKIVSKVAGCIDGSGGGKKEFAQAGGKRPAGLAAAIEEAKRLVEMGSGPY